MAFEAIKRRAGALVLRLEAACPDRVALAIARCVGWLEWRLRAGRRAATLEGLSCALAATPREGDVARLGPRHAIASRLVEQLMRRPEISRRGRVVGGATLDALRGEGRGAIVMHTHVGWMVPSMYTLAAHGHADAGVAGAVEPWAVQAVEAVVSRDGCEVVLLGGAYARLRALLGEGKIVHIAFDAPGNLSCVLLAKPAAVGSGIVRLARETGAPVVPVTTTAPGLRMTVDVGAPVRASSFADEAALAQHLADLASADILRLPEAWQLDSTLWPDAPPTSSVRPTSRRSRRAAG